ncbi:hypothetical protein [Flavobacterium sp.]|uniref:hypothetical protein n=1 Tax=Flavobacterium sp. TaxID=239 RepID=UPI0026128C7B|nr:hypothetical protein [Flavobacterium sp.]
MKNCLTLLLFAFVLNLSAQNNKLEKGEFSSITPSAETLKFHISDDNKFQLSILSGTYEEVNDSIYFNTSYADMPKFNLKYSNPNPKSDKITIDLGEFSYYQYYSIYIGTQKNINSPVEYKPMKDLLDIKYSDYEAKKLTFEIDKVEFIYLVEDNLKKESFIEKFQVPNDVSKIDVQYSSFSIAKLKFRGVYNQETKELIVTEGKSPIVFSKKVVQEVSEKPIEKRVQKNWTYDGKIADPTYDYDYPVDSTSVGVGYADQVPQYVFKLKIEKTLAEAQKEASKYPNKMLVVFYDTNKNAQKEFDQYIENYQTNNQYNMYDKYNPEYDNFNFYLATDKDKNSLKKLGITDNQSVIFLNSDGEKLYHTKAKITDDDYAYYNLSSINIDLKPINAHAQFDKVLSNKKKSNADIQNTFLNITKSGRSNYTSVMPPPAYPATDAVIQVKELGVVEPVEDAAITVDSTAVVQDYYDYSVLKEKNNIYKLKSSQKEVELKYKQLLDFHQNDKTVDVDFLKIIISELSMNSGFSNILFNKYDEALNANDFQSIDYVLKFFNEIPKIEAVDYYDQYTTTSLIGIISNALNRTSNKSQTDKVIAYYDKLLKTTNDDSWVLKGKMSLLKENQKDNEFLNTFDAYFKSFIKDDSSIIEQLDKKYNSETDYSWNEFKSTFANEANEAAWFVVENVKSQTPSILKNAIKWSETSLIIEKNSPYYLDTLAQLYYRNGEKEKAILTEQKAIDNIKDGTFEQIEEYKLVLEKMKNGTY